MAIIIFILTLLVLVVIHEFGHYFAAKKFNIKVLEFGFGIPPRAWGKKIGETIYSLNWLPAGGFVRLLGEDEVDKKILENHRSFAAQNVWKRIVVVVAGVTMNFLLAFLLYYIVLGAQGFKVQLPLLIDHNFVGVQQTEEQLLIINQVAPDSPAQQAGLKPSDRIVAVNGVVADDSDEFSETVKSSAGREITLTISDPLQKEQSRDVKIFPRENPPEGEGAIGVGFFQTEIANLNYETPMQRLFAGPIHSWNVISYSFKILGNMIGRAFEEQNLAPVAQNAGGPVRIASIANDILSVDNPLIPYLDFVAIISLNLAVLNILPIPAMDGGRLFFLMIEAVTRRRVHANFERWVHTVGIVVLIFLFLLITLSDIQQVFFR